MRLLNARTKTLEEFFDDNIPRYAILSHTWGHNEPTYRDFAAPGNRDANIKIDGCCDQALLDKYEYVWIDTICIDKSSSAELSEAINSMYTWYESAGVCYAYLSDVSSDHNTPVAQLVDPDTDFCRSKWFTRGWTLQELIAPRRVVFYNSRWLKIMEKRILRDWDRPVYSREEKQRDWHSVLGKITRIPYEVLNGSAALTEITVAARMTWAANRRTTRKEDIAYCLLGIFKINMSMLYGEGDRAFTRLQEEIIRISDDETIFAWGFNNEKTHDACATKNRLLASSPADFLGCEKIRKFSPTEYFRSGNRMPTHYSMTNKGLLFERPLMVLPAPFYTALVPLNCTPDPETCSKILALPLKGGEILDGAQLVMDSSCCPVLVAPHVFWGEKETTKIYINTGIATPDDRDYEKIRIGVTIQETSSGAPTKGVYPTWFISQFMSRRDTRSAAYLLTPISASMEHALVDLACPNGQRYMVHIVQSYTSTVPNALSFIVGVSRQESYSTVVEDILRLKKDGYFAPELSHDLWPTTSDDGYVRLELSGPSDDWQPSDDWHMFFEDWTMKIHVSCGEEAAT